MSQALPQPGAAESQPDLGRGSMEELLSQARLEGHKITEIDTWEADTIVVPPGAMGIIPTRKLNGCHVSVIIGRLPSGERSLSMAHFPPGWGTTPYWESVKAIEESMWLDGVEPEAVVTLTALDRPAPETAILAHHLFPQLPVHSLFYTAHDPQRKAREDAGICVAALDTRDQNAPQLHVMTDSGDKSIPLTPISETTPFTPDESKTADVVDEVPFDESFEARTSGQFHSHMTKEAIRRGYVYIDGHRASITTLQDGRISMNGHTPESAARYRARLRNVIAADTSRFSFIAPPEQ